MYRTVGHAVHRRVTPHAGDMSWLGEPMGESAARRYEAWRLARHKGALQEERRRLEAEAADVARRFAETAAQKSRKSERLNAISAQISAKCSCAICKGNTNDSR